MGAILNGICLVKLRPFGSGFFIFVDYMRGSLRLSALMEVPVIYVFTHDSIGVGEDGPTHQPIEQLAHMRSMPGLKYAPASGLARGAYILADATGGNPEVILIGTGSEVALCLEAYEQLTKEGVRARVVSMPSWELFASWLHRLHKEGWLQVVASAAPRANIDAVLVALSATHMFQGIVSADDVHRGKPDPEVFLIAASRVGVSPDRCFVVEDAVAGVQGARSAGMKSIGVSRNGRQLPADVVMQSLDLLDPDAFDTLLEGHGSPVRTA